MSICRLGTEDDIWIVKNNQKEDKKMKGFGEKWDRIFSAITFAEAGEFETAREIMREKSRDEKRDTPIARKTARISAPGAKR